MSRILNKTNEELDRFVNNVGEQLAVLAKNEKEFKQLVVKFIKLLKEAAGV